MCATHTCTHTVRVCVYVHVHCTCVYECMCMCVCVNFIYIYIYKFVFIYIFQCNLVIIAYLIIYMYLSRIILSCALKHVNARNEYCRFDPVISNHNSRRPYYIFTVWRIHIAIEKLLSINMGVLLIPPIT